MWHANRRKFLSAWGFLALGFALHRLADSAKKRPNILYIMADDHTTQALGCYGSRLAKYAPTMNIDRLAKEGAMLINCFCPNSICVPSRASILTGQYSHINGVKTLKDRLAPETDNVAKHLRAAGYETAIVGKWHLKDQPAGFDYYNVLRGQGRYHDPILFESGKNWKSEGRIYKGHSTDVITDQALAWLKNSDSERRKPFCMMVHYKAAHEPYYSDDRFRSLLEDEDLPEPDDLYWPESPKGKVFNGWPLETLGERFMTRPEQYSPPVLKAENTDANALRKAIYQKFIKDYLRTVAGIDENIGRLLAYLDKTGQSKNTVVIYTSDQGYFLGEHNLFDKRFFLEESVRMPFVIRYPAEIEPGTTVKDIILNIDFAELLLDYAGAKIPETMQGRSFRQNLQGNTPKDWRTAMYYRYWENSPERPSHYGVRTHTHKLIYYDGLENNENTPGEFWELYDLKADPHEHVNVYGKAENENIIEELKRTLERLKTEFNDTQ